MRIQSRIRNLGLKVSSDATLEALAADKKIEFHRHVVEAEDGSAESLAFLETLMKCSSDYCQRHLLKAGFDIDTHDLTMLAIDEGKKFFQAVNALAHGGELASQALAYLHSLVEIEDIGSVAGTPTSPATNKSALERNSQPESPKYDSYHVYSSKFALCFSIGKAADFRSYVLNIDGAPAIVRKQFDWKKKIAIQLNSEEVFRLLAVMQIKLLSVEFTAHGKQNDKSFSMQAQVEKGHYFAILNQGARSMPLPIPPAAGLSLSVMLVKLIFLNAPHLSDKTLDELLAPLVQMSAQKKVLQHE